MNSRPVYEIRESTTKTFAYQGYERVRLENIGCPKQPLAVRIGNNPAVVLTSEQMTNIAKALEMDETVQQVVQILQQRIIHGDPLVRKTLCKLFRDT